jgi:Na+-driven multidrug efflux pump
VGAYPFPQVQVGEGSDAMKKFLKYELQSVAGMVGISVYILADTFFISVYAGADGLAMLNLVLPVWDQPRKRGGYRRLLFTVVFL